MLFFIEAPVWTPFCIHFLYFWRKENEKIHCVDSLYLSWCENPTCWSDFCSFFSGYCSDADNDHSQYKPFWDDCHDRPDCPGWRDSWGVGSSGLPLLGGCTERRMLPTPPTGLWESVQTAWQVIPLSVLILKKHFLFFLWRWTIITFCPSASYP